MSLRANRIKRVDPQHVYYVDGSSFMYRSVTTLLDDYRPFDAESVLLQYYADWQQCRSRKPECYDKLPDEIKAMWDDKREKGIAMHAAIQSHFEGKPLMLANDAKVLAQVQSFLQHLSACHGRRPEMMLFDEDLRIAGSVDLVEGSDGTVTIYDWKRSKPELDSNGAVLKQFDSNGAVLKTLQSKLGKWSLQLNLYAYMLRVKYGCIVHGMKVVCFHPDLEEAKEIAIEPLDRQLEEIIADRKSFLEYHAHAMVCIAKSIRARPLSDVIHEWSFLRPHCFSDSCFSHVIEITKPIALTMEWLNTTGTPDSHLLADCMFSELLLPWRPPGPLDDAQFADRKLPKLVVTSLGEKLQPSLRVDADEWKRYISDPELLVSFAMADGNMKPTTRDFEDAWKNIEDLRRQVLKARYNGAVEDVKRKRS